MKKGILRLSVVLLVSIMTFSGCSKYEEGPSISLRTKKARMANEWVYEKYIVNGVDQDISYFADFVMTLEKDGTGKYSFGDQSQDIQWEFNDSKEEFRIKDTDEDWDDDDYMTITKLKNDELWIKDDTDEIHLKSK